MLIVTLMATAASCAGRVKQRRIERPRPAGEPPPSWVTHIDLQSDKLCGVGIAGAAFDKRSPYPKRLSEQRAVKNLAGALETNIQEAIIDRDVNRRHTIDTARVLTIDEALIEQVAAMAKTEFWLDEGGTGPFQQRNFTYAHTCIDAKLAADTLRVHVADLKGPGKRQPQTPARVPDWIRRTGKQAGGRLCAVGFSLPTFHPDKTFDVVVEDIRSQLADVLQTLVSSYYEELSSHRYQLYEMMTVATTQAISKGAIVTSYWYDRDGIGPFRRKRSTYGWGCVYPVDVMKTSIASVEKELPEQVIAKVRERAQSAFDELDAEIDKREGPSIADLTPSAEPAPPPATPAAPAKVESGAESFIDAPEGEPADPPLSEAPMVEPIEAPVDVKEAPVEVEPAVLDDVEYR
jgi:hypothetical protein